MKNNDPRLYFSQDDSERREIKRQIYAQGFQSVKEFCEKTGLDYGSLQSKLHSNKPLDIKTISVLKENKIQFKVLQKVVTYVEVAA